jgi:hypothetical protein
MMKLVAAVYAFKHPFDPNGPATLPTFERLRIGQAHEAAARGAWHELIGADRSNPHGFRFATGA